MPDPFELATKSIDSSTLTEATSNASDAPFSAEDRALAETQMKQLREYIASNNSLTPEQLSSLDERVDHFIEATNRLSKKDWLLILYGGLFAIVISGLYDQTRPKELFDYAAQLVAFLLQPVILS